MIARLDGAGRVVLSIEVRQTATLGEGTRAAIVAVCLAASPHQPGFADLFSLLPPDGLHLLGRVQGELVGHAVLTTRWAQPGGHLPLRTAYVDAVATTPTHRDHGYASALLRRLAAVAADHEYEIACLETRRAGFYERLGWERWRGPLAGRDGDELIPTPEQDGVMFLRLPRTPPLDPANLLTIERQPNRIW